MRGVYAHENPHFDGGSLAAEYRIRLIVDRRKALLNRALICQAFGEALDADKLEQLVRYEVHLDRKLERMLAMLLRLKDLRHGTNGG